MSRTKKIVMSVSTFFVILIAGVAGFLYWQTKSIVSEFDAGTKRHVVISALPELNKAPKDPASLEHATNILLIGADVRHGEGGNGRSDTLMLLRINPRRKTISMMSIPRDLQVTIPGYGSSKINAAYAYGGAKLAIATVRETSELRSITSPSLIWADFARSFKMQVVLMYLLIRDTSIRMMVRLLATGHRSISKLDIRN